MSSTETVLTEPVTHVLGVNAAGVLAIEIVARDEQLDVSDLFEAVAHVAHFWADAEGVDVTVSWGGPR